jgi:hypothetical protein
MTSRTPTDVKNLDRYGNDAMPWSRVRDRLETQPAGPGRPFFLSTATTDGTPHSASVGAVWLDGDFYFTSNPDTRKSRHLATNPACTIAVALEGIDVVFEGEAARVTEPKILDQVAAMYREGGWPAEVEGDAITAPFSAPSAGPPPWLLYRFTFHTAFGVGTAEPYGATRWRFDR